MAQDETAHDQLSQKALDQYYEYYYTMYKGLYKDSDPVIEEIVEITSRRRLREICASRESKEPKYVQNARRNRSR